jgi:hypothetical protein
MFGAKAPGKKRGAAPLSGAEEQTTRAIGAYAQCAFSFCLKMGNIN